MEIFIFFIGDFRKILHSSDIWDFPFSFMGLLVGDMLELVLLFISFVTDDCLCLLLVFEGS